MPTFPPGVTPLAWFNGNLPAFADLAGTGAAIVGGPLGRVNEAAPLTGNWQAPSNTQRPQWDGASARLHYFGSPYSQQLVSSTIPSLTTNNFLLAISFMSRDGLAGPAQGLLRAGALGLYAGGKTLAVTHSNGSANWSPALPEIAAAKHVTFVVKYTSTGLKAWLLLDGALSTDATVTTVTGAALAQAFIVGAVAGGPQGVYGSVSQAMVAAAPSDADALALAQWLDAQPVPTGFPTTAPLVAVQGDSIARNVPGAYIWEAWCWMCLRDLRAGDYPTCEMFNGAVGGAGAGGVINTAAAYYSAQRSRNVMVIAIGTNDLATGVSEVTTLNTILAQYDAALAIGWRPAIATILDRTGALSISQSTFNTRRAYVNAGILSSGRNVIDLTGVAGVSAEGSASGPNFIDTVHPGTLGHALMYPAYMAAIQSLLAPDPIRPTGPAPVASRLWPSIRIAGDKPGVLIG